MTWWKNLSPRVKIHMHSIFQKLGTKSRYSLITLAGSSKRLGSSYRSGSLPHGLKVKNPKAPAVKREAGEDWGSPHWIKVKKASAAKHDA